jgi:histone deacetylase 1/2
MPAFRLFMAISATKGHTVRHYDVDTAFLNAELKDEVFINIPPGAPKPTPTSVWKLHRALYGLKQANRGWKDELTQTLISAGYRPTSVEPCLYIHSDGSSMACHHVDDILSSTSSTSAHNFLHQALSLAYSIKDLGYVSRYVGLQIQRTQSGAFTLSQTEYIERALQQFGLAEAHTSPVPMSKADIFSPLDSDPFEGPYKELVGTLIYAMTATRPDISFATSKACSHMASPTKHDWTSAKKVLRYLKATKHLKLTLSGSGLELSAYCDADWASDPKDRKSTSGFLIFLGKSLISWTSKKQSTIAMSSMEAEFLSLTNCIQDILYLRTLLAELHINQKGPTLIHQDNQACILFAQTGNISSRTKHIELREHFVFEQISKGNISLNYIPTTEMLADSLTKPTSAQTLRDFNNKTSLK